MTTDTTERGLESLICASLTGGASVKQLMDRFSGVEEWKV